MSANDLVPSKMEIIPWKRLEREALRGGVDVDVYIESMNAHVLHQRQTLSRLHNEAGRMRAALKYAEAVMTIVRPRSDMAEYLACLKQIREALGQQAGEAVTGTVLSSAAPAEMVCNTTAEPERSPPNNSGAISQSETTAPPMIDAEIYRGNKVIVDCVELTKYVTARIVGRIECATGPGNDEPAPEPTDAGGVPASPPAERCAENGEEHHGS